MAALFFASVASAEVKLPVTLVNGRECFYYKPQSGSETVYGLSKRLGLTREEIVAYNPSVADGLRKNMTLYFPVSDFRDRIGIDADGSDAVVLDVPSETLTPVKIMSEVEADDKPRTVPDPPEPENTLRPVNIQPEVTPNTVRPYTIAVLMPFALASEDVARPAKNVTDFYKGFLIAADTLASRGDTVFVSAYDTAGGLDAILSKPEVREASVIVAPDDAAFPLEALRAGANGYILNTLCFGDTLYLSQPQVVQTAVPHTAMYSKAVDYFIKNIAPGTVPVIMSNTEGRNDKEAFTAYLCDRLAREQIPYKELKYDGTLTSFELNDAALPAAGKLVIVPSAGSIGEFNRFSHALNNYRIANPELEMVLFGYPEWISFRGDAEDMLHSLGAVIYSRFSGDYAGFSARCIQDDFIRWYGSPMIESIPSYGLLGYDTGAMLIKNLRANKGLFRPAYPSEYRGIQSTFRLVPAGEDGGFVNDALYIIRYLPVTGTDEIVL